MLKQMEGSQAVAEAVALCRPEVVCAYPITPQTHIVEGVGRLVKEGTLENCEASAAGARSYTATASQGLLFMGEAVYNAAGLGLPIVMTIGNRAIGAPINIWNDHTDSMAMRDAGWIQLFAETNQEAVDLHIQAFRLAEELSCPVMVCMDGFILTHAYEPLDVPGQEQVDAFLPPFEPVQILDPDDPYSIGAMVGPDAFTEVRYLANDKQLQALRLIPDIAEAFQEGFGRDSGGLFHGYRTEDADTIAVALGSVNGTIKEVVDRMRDQGAAVGVISLCSFRPFPLDALGEALTGAKRVVVIEKSLAPGLGGVVASNVRMALHGMTTPVYTVIAGLGGRPITMPSLTEVFEAAGEDRLPDVQFLDLDHAAVEHEIVRARATRLSGPTAEAILRRKGLGATRVV
jgi:pyruvate ferredoxin oxidoreductase alpha subunit